MNNRLKLYARVGLVCAGLLVAFSLATAQVASHASTAGEATTRSDFSTTPALQPVGRPVARVNGAVLTDRDLLREMFNIFPYARQHNGFPQAMEADIRAGAMKMMIFEELVYQQAKRSGMTVPPERVARGMGEFRKRFDSPAEYQEFVKEEFHGSQQLLQTKVERSLLIDKYLKLKVADKSAVSMAEAKAYFDQHPERFQIAESFSFQSITLLPPQNATASQLKEERKRAEDAVKQAKATKNYEEFGVLAEKISEDDFRVVMGAHKAADRSKLPPAVVNALVAMQPDQVSDACRVRQKCLHHPAANRSHFPRHDEVRRCKRPAVRAIAKEQDRGIAPHPGSSAKEGRQGRGALSCAEPGHISTHFLRA